MKILLNIPRIPMRQYGEHVVLANILKALAADAPADWQLITHTMGRRALSEHRESVAQIDPRGRMTHRFNPVPYTLLEQIARRTNFSSEFLFGASDVVHSFSGLVPRTRKLIVTIHDVIFLRMREAQQSPEWVLKSKDALSRLVSRAAAVHTVSEYSKQELVTWLGVEPERVVVIPNGVDHNIYRPLADSERADADLLVENLGVSGPYLLHIGGNAKRKNVGSLIATYRLLRERYEIDHSLVLVGSELTAELADIAGRYSADIHCLGYLSRTEAVAVLQRAHALIFPSLYEGFGLPIIEAMACGVPAALSRTSSLPEIGGDAALYFDPLDVEGTAKMVFNLIADGKLRSQCVQRGLSRAANFSWTRVASELMWLYKSVGVSEQLGRPLHEPSARPMAK